ncbi:hypothetical protein MMC28_007324 [Mycoblastus sanguinarius]|nr:hypothetical protein [Mycoblastus sanguinarius]
MANDPITRWRLQGTEHLNIIVIGLIFSWRQGAEGIATVLARRNSSRFQTMKRKDVDDVYEYVKNTKSPAGNTYRYFRELRDRDLKGNDKVKDVIMELDRDWNVAVRQEWYDGAADP